MFSRLLLSVIEYYEAGRTGTLIIDNDVFVLDKHHLLLPDDICCAELLARNVVTYIVDLCRHIAAHDSTAECETLCNLTKELTTQPLCAAFGVYATEICRAVFCYNEAFFTSQSTTLRFQVLHNASLAARCLPRANAARDDYMLSRCNGYVMQASEDAAILEQSFDAAIEELNQRVA